MIALDRKGVGAAPVDEAQRDQLISQFRQRASRAFLRAYWDATDTRSGPATRALLDLFLIEKAAYEIAYESLFRLDELTITRRRDHDLEHQNSPSAPRGEAEQKKLRKN
jgi:predicted trehalose synthase